MKHYNRDLVIRFFNINLNYSFSLWEKVGMYIFMDPKTFRRCLRRESTPAESALWVELRNRKFMGLKFRRQHSLGQYVVDFFNAELKLIIEVDGGYHNNLGQADYDDNRDSSLKMQGYRIYRVDNGAVLTYMETVLDELKALTLTPSEPAGGLSQRERELNPGTFTDIVDFDASSFRQNVDENTL